MVNRDIRLGDHGGPESRWSHLLLLVAVVAVFVWSAIRPLDRFTWWLEVAPVVVGIPVLIGLYPRFRFTTLAYTLIAAHAIVLIVGGHYTYAQVPLGDWMRDWFGFDRNEYDRIGHVMQGFAPAIVAREVLLRRSPLVPGKWTAFLVICFCLALSAAYELVEWRVAVASGSDAVAFLATQGDPWDTQWDMFLAFAGAIASLVILTKWHNRQLKSLLPHF